LQSQTVKNGKKDGVIIRRRNSRKNREIGILKKREDGGEGEDTKKIAVQQGKWEGV